MPWRTHELRAGSKPLSTDETPSPSDLRQRIEPWLSAVFQSEHLSLLVGSGFPMGVGAAAGTTTSGMGIADLAVEQDIGDIIPLVNEYAEETAERIGRGTANIEDQIRAALTLLNGLEGLRDIRKDSVRVMLDTLLLNFLRSLLEAEQQLVSCN